MRRAHILRPRERGEEVAVWVVFVVLVAVLDVNEGALATAMREEGEGEGRFGSAAKATSSRHTRMRSFLEEEIWVGVSTSISAIVKLVGCFSGCVGEWLWFLWSYWWKCWLDVTIDGKIENCRSGLSIAQVLGSTFVVAKYYHYPSRAGIVEGTDGVASR